MKTINTSAPNEAETQEIYTIYCQLSTIIHDYCIGDQLFKRNCFSWAITSKYYSMMHCGRFICLLGLKEYPRRHDHLHDFLQGKNQFNGSTFRDLINSVKSFSNIKDLEQKISRLGEKLENLKKLREHNSYDFFIISHQINHSVLSPEFRRLYKEMKKLNKDYLIFVLDLLVDYINSLGYKDHFASFLKDTNKKHKWALKSLKKDLNIQKMDDKIIEKVFSILNKKLLSNFNTGIKLPDSFFKPIKFYAFPTKYNNMREFIDNINELTEKEEVSNKIFFNFLTLYLSL